jgi:hypothetical protein
MSSDAIHHVTIGTGGFPEEEGLAGYGRSTHHVGRTLAL